MNGRGIYLELLTVNFLFNLSLLIVFLFFCIMWAEKSGKKRLDKGTAILYFVCSLVLCISSYRLNEGMVLDLRIVPYLIGSLYMGLSPILGLLIILIRAFHGFDIGFYIGVVFYGLFSFLLWYISPWFKKRTPKFRILFSVRSSTLLVSLLILVGIEIIAPPSHSLDLWFAYLFVPPLGVAMISYTIEVSENNILMQQRLVKSEKLEAVEQMGAAISHEIRNPLTSAMGFLQLLDDDLLHVRKGINTSQLLKRNYSQPKKLSKII